MSSIKIKCVDEYDNLIFLIDPINGSYQHASQHASQKAGSNNVLSIYGKLSISDGILTNKLNLGISSIYSGSFLINNDQQIPCDVRGLNFSDNVISFVITLTVNVQFDIYDYYETFTLEGCRTNSEWILLTTNYGDDCGIIFSIKDGQIMYTSNNLCNFKSGIFNYWVKCINKKEENDLDKIQIPTGDICAGIITTNMSHDITFPVISDKRLKTNIELADLDTCYNTIKNIPLKQYTWESHSKLGWIGQDVEKIIPNAVKKTNTLGYTDCRTLNSDQIIASLYGCVQKLIQINEKQDDYIHYLNDTVNKLISENEIQNIQIHGLMQNIEYLRNESHFS